MKQSKWEKVGYIGVDAGLCWVGDPCYVMGTDASHGPSTWEEFCDNLENVDKPLNGYPTVVEPCGKGIGFAVSTGYGDGSYAVYVRRELATNRIAAVKVVFIPNKKRY